MKSIVQALFVFSGILASAGAFVSPREMTAKPGDIIWFRCNYSTSGEPQTVPNSKVGNLTSTKIPSRNLASSYISSATERRHMLIRFYTVVGENVDFSSKGFPQIIYNGERVKESYDGVYIVEDVPGEYLTLIVNTTGELDGFEVHGTYEFIEIPAGMTSIANLTLLPYSLEEHGNLLKPNFTAVRFQHKEASLEKSEVGDWQGSNAYFIVGFVSGGILITCMIAVIFAHRRKKRSALKYEKRSCSARDDDHVAYTILSYDTVVSFSSNCRSPAGIQRQNTTTSSVMSFTSPSYSSTSSYDMEIKRDSESQSISSPYEEIRFE